jgi:hypothetical protein
MVVAANASSQPYAMVIMSGNTSIAKTTMFAPCWFRKLAGATLAAWMKNDIIIGISLKLILDVFGSYNGFGHDAGI